ncbi:MAG: Zn-dependent hydrolase, partial [Proteobacteria bacterium]|nr:Zn-dependent hydrolase [Pseudomonadota bacterium]
MLSRSIFVLSILLFPVLQAAAPAYIHANPESMEQHIKALSAFGANADGGVDRVAYSEADLAARAYIRDLMREAGLTVRLDTAGNIIGR